MIGHLNIKIVCIYGLEVKYFFLGGGGDMGRAEVGSEHRSLK